MSVCAHVRCSVEATERDLGSAALRRLVGMPLPSSSSSADSKDSVGKSERKLAKIGRRGKKTDLEERNKKEESPAAPLSLLARSTGERRAGLGSA